LSAKVDSVGQFSKDLGGRKRRKERGRKVTREGGEGVKDWGRLRKEVRWEESKEGGMEGGREEEGWESGRKGRREGWREGERRKGGIVGGRDKGREEEGCESWRKVRWREVVK